MRLGMQLMYSGGFKETAEQVQTYEKAGLDIVWVAEAYGFDAPSFMGYLAALTETVQIGAGILPIYTRTPGLMAQTAVGIDAVSNGRCILGLGTSGPQVIEGWHGVPFSAPLGRTRELVEICRAAWRRETLTYDGKVYQLPLPPGEGTGLGKPLKMLTRPVRDSIPVWIASLGPKNVALTAEIADGWLPIWTPVSDIPSVMAAFRSQVEAAGRPAGAVTVRSPGEIVVTTDVERARAAVAGNFAFYVSRMGVFYHRHVSRLGYETEAARIREAWDSGGSKAAAAAVPADLQQRLTFVTDSTQAARERLAEQQAAGIQLHTVSVQTDSASERRKIYEALAG